MSDKPIIFGATAWTDTLHYPCPEQDTCPFGHGNLPRPDNEPTLFGIQPSERRRHLLILGATGQGKTTLLRNMLLDDIAAGRGVALLDPHGDFSTDLMSAIPPSRTRKTILFDPADLAYPIGLNVLESVDADYHFLVADQLISVFRNIWHDSWGPRMEYHFHSAILSLLQVEGSTLLGVPRLFTDKAYRAWIVSRLSDPLLRRFWTHEFEPMSTSMQREAASPILNKIGQFLNAPMLRHIVGQVHPKLDFTEVMDESHIFIANLAKGRIGEHNAMLLGSLLLTKFFLAALRRQDQPEDERVDFFITADEVHNLAHDMLAELLSEARKYKVSMTAATQYLNSLSPSIRSAVFGNVGTILTFRIGAEDAETLATSFAPHVQPTDLQSIARHEFYIKLALSRGGVTQPFHATSLPPQTPSYAPQHRERVVRSSRERFGLHRNSIEGQINRWVERAKGPGPDAPGPQAVGKKPKFF